MKKWLVWWCRGRVFQVDSIVAKAKGALAGGAKVLVCHVDDAEEVHNAVAAGEEGLEGGSLKVVGISDLVGLMRYAVGTDPSLPDNIQCAYLVRKSDSFCIPNGLTIDGGCVWLCAWYRGGQEAAAGAAGRTGRGLLPGLCVLAHI